MGYAIAAAAVERGHEVILVSGPVCLSAPKRVELCCVSSAQEMYEAVAARLIGCDAAVMTAAVADYRPARIEERKIKKTDASLTLSLERTPDILGSARDVMGFAGLLVGFAAETDDLSANARDKLEKKKCDLIVANDVSRDDIGFGSDRNEVTVFFGDGRELPLDKVEKVTLGARLVEIIEQECLPADA